MVRVKTLVAVHLWAFCIALTQAQSANIRLSSFPTATVADSRSTITVTVELRDSNGKFVPDGTQVLLQTTIGSFRESQVSTVSGYARGILVSGSIPGTAKITAICPQFGATTNLEVEMLSDRSLLSSSREFAEVVAPGYLQMSYERRILAAAAPNNGVHIRFLGIEIEADDVQIEPNSLEVKARRAWLQINQHRTYFDQLNFDLKRRKGVGITQAEVTRPAAIVGQGRGFGLMMEKVNKLAQVEVNSSGIRPLELGLPEDTFQFQDLSQSTSLIAARKAVIFPNRQIQFQKAEILIDGARMLKFPLFEAKLDGSATPVLGESVVNISNSKPSVNYPYYLSLKPGETSLLRFHTGDRYGRSLSTNNGAFIDYELNWNRGSDSDGGLVFSGLGRNDWSLGLRHYVKMGSDSSFSAEMNTPTGRSALSTLNFNQGFRGYQANVSLSSNSSFRGPLARNNIVSAVIEKDPLKLGSLPLKVFFGISANAQTLVNETDRTSQSGVGLRMRTQLDQRRLDKKSTLDGSITFSKLGGHNAKSAFGTVASLAIRSRVAQAAYISMGYDYVNDGLSSALTGKHRVSMQGYMNTGRLSLSGLTSRGIDGPTGSTQLDLNYTFSGLWRFGFSQTIDRYLQGSFVDYNAVLAYRYGIREFGLTYSKNTKKLGLQLLGSSFN